MKTLGIDENHNKKLLTEIVGLIGLPPVDIFGGSSRERMQGRVKGKGAME